MSRKSRKYIYTLGDVCVNRLPTETQIFKIGILVRNSHPIWLKSIVKNCSWRTNLLHIFMKMFCTGSLLTLKIINNSHCQKFWIYDLFFFFPLRPILLSFLLCKLFHLPSKNECGECVN